MHLDLKTFVLEKHYFFAMHHLKHMEIKPYELTRTQNPARFLRDLGKNGFGEREDGGMYPDVAW